MPFRVTINSIQYEADTAAEIVELHKLLANGHGQLAVMTSVPTKDLKPLPVENLPPHLAEISESARLMVRFLAMQDEPISRKAIQKATDCKYATVCSNLKANPKELTYLRHHDRKNT